MLRNAHLSLVALALALVACGEALPDLGDAGPLIPDFGPAPDDGPLADEGPRLETVPVTVTFFEVGPGETTGYTVCVHEYPQVDCVRAIGERAVEIDVPVGPLHLVATSDGYVPTILPVMVPEDGIDLGRVIFFTEEQAAAGQTEAQVTQSDDLGAMIAWVKDGQGPDDTFALVGGTFVGPGGTDSRYTTPDGAVSPDLEAMVESGSAVVYNIPEGTQTFAWRMVEGVCEAPELGWATEDGAAVIDALVLPGHLTIAYLDCSSLRGRFGRDCDPVAQDCGDGEKCRGVFFDDSRGVPRFGSRCVADGSVALGESCARVNDEAGNDDCTSGGYCAYWDLPRSEPQARRCLPFCEGDIDCAPSQQCLGLGTIEGPGTCVDRCEPFGDDCVAGTHCAGRISVRNGEAEDAIFQCQFIGELGEGESCDDAEQCDAGLSCVGRACRALCNDDNPCGDGFTCEAIGNLPDGSYCAPD